MSLSKHREAAIADLVLAFGSLIRRMRAASPSEINEFSLTQRSVIVRLDKDGPMTTAELARAEGVKPQSMGTAIENLEKMDFVERKPHATDGRQVNIALTAKGKRIRGDNRTAKQTWLMQAVQRLDKDDQETLFAAAKIIKRMVDL